MESHVVQNADGTVRVERHPVQGTPVVGTEAAVLRFPTPAQVDE
jgi:hypothetical protein